MNKVLRNSLLIALAIVGALALSAPAVQPAVAQVLESDVDDLRYRLRKLERQFKSMREQSGSSDIPSTLATRFQNRLNQLERTIQKLTAKAEDLAHRVSKMEKEQKTFRNDVDYRLNMLEKKRGGADGRSGDDKARRAGIPQKRSRRQESRREAETGLSILPRGKEIDQYRFAIGELRKARYGRAARAFKEFLRRHPKGRFAGNAYYWLGETYFAQKKYRLAAIRFADGLQKFPKHPKAPDNLLKLGLSMARLDKPREACASWTELRRSYPGAPGYVKRRVTREWKKLDCRS